MVTVINDNFMVCGDCIQAIANDDYTGLDYYYSVEEAGERMQDILDGMRNAGGSIYAGDSVKDDDFSKRPCDCCGTGLYGARFHCVVLK